MTISTKGVIMLPGKIMVVALFALMLLTSCSKKDEQPEATRAEKMAGELTEESLRFLNTAPNIISTLAELKHDKVTYIKYETDLSRFKVTKTRDISIIRFGILTADIAYKKILGSDTQLPEHIEVYDRFVKELNVDPVITETFRKYLDKTAGKELDTILLDELKTDLEKEQTAIVAKLKDVDEEFLVYYSLGLLIEVSWLKQMIQNDPKAMMKTRAQHPPLKPFGNFIHALMATKNYGKIAMELQPVTDIMLGVQKDPNMTPAEKKKVISETLTKFRERVLI